MSTSAAAPASAYIATMRLRTQLGSALVSDEACPAIAPVFTTPHLWATIIAFALKEVPKPSRFSSYDPHKNERAEMFHLSLVCRTFRYLIERSALWLNSRFLYTMAYRYYGKALEKLPNYNEYQSKVVNRFLMALSFADAQDIRQMASLLRENFPLFDRDNVFPAFVASHKVFCGATDLSFDFAGGNDGEPKYNVVYSMRQNNTPVPVLSGTPSYGRVREKVDREQLVIAKVDKIPADRHKFPLPDMHITRLVGAIDALQSVGWCVPSQEPLCAYAFAIPEVVSRFTEDMMITLLQALLVRGGNINQGTYANNKTPLFSAIQQKRPRVIDWLLSKGADPKAPLTRGLDDKIQAGTTSEHIANMVMMDLAATDPVKTALGAVFERHGMFV